MYPYIYPPVDLKTVDPVLLHPRGCSQTDILLFKHTNGHYTSEIN